MENNSLITVRCHSISLASFSMRLIWGPGCCRKGLNQAPAHRVGVLFIFSASSKICHCGGDLPRRGKFQIRSMENPSHASTPPPAKGGGPQNGYSQRERKF